MGFIAKYLWALCFFYVADEADTFWLIHWLILGFFILFIIGAIAYNIWWKYYYTHINKKTGRFPFGDKGPSKKCYVIYSPDGAHSKFIFKDKEGNILEHLTEEW